eukprot:845570-Amphidinium_carterae.1
MAARARVLDFAAGTEIMSAGRSSELNKMGAAWSRIFRSTPFQFVCLGSLPVQTFSLAFLNFRPRLGALFLWAGESFESSFCLCPRRMSTKFTQEARKQSNKPCEQKGLQMICAFLGTCHRSRSCWRCACSTGGRSCRALCIRCKTPPEARGQQPCHRRRTERKTPNPPPPVNC